MENLKQETGRKAVLPKLFDITFRSIQTRYT